MENQVIFTKEQLEKLEDALDRTQVMFEAALNKIEDDYKLSEGEQEAHNIIRHFATIYTEIFYNFLAGKDQL